MSAPQQQGIRIDPQAVIDRLSTQLGMMAAEVARWQVAFEQSQAEVAELRAGLPGAGDSSAPADEGPP